MHRLATVVRETMKAEAMKQLAPLRGADKEQAEKTLDIIMASVNNRVLQEVALAEAAEESAIFDKAANMLGELYAAPMDACSYNALVVKHAIGELEDRMFNRIFDTSHMENSDWFRKFTQVYNFLREIVLPDILIKAGVLGKEKQAGYIDWVLRYYELYCAMDLIPTGDVSLAGKPPFGTAADWMELCQRAGNVFDSVDEMRRFIDMYKHLVAVGLDYRK